MPEKRLQRIRETLPTDYQFGDAAPLHVQTARLLRRYDENVGPFRVGETIVVKFTPCPSWNVIEGEDH